MRKFWYEPNYLDWIKVPNVQKVTNKKRVRKTLDTFLGKIYNFEIVSYIYELIPCYESI